MFMNYKDEADDADAETMKGGWSHKDDPFAWTGNRTEEVKAKHPMLVKLMADREFANAMIALYMKALP